MPELPEVETIVRDLRGVLPGRRIERVELGRRQVLKSARRRIIEALKGAKIQSVERWGKNIVICSENLCWIVHLGMTGRLGLHRAGEARPPHTHGVFTLDDGKELRYTDARMFGRIEVGRVFPARLNKLGPDPLEITEKEFVERLRRRRGGVKAMLLDQRFLRGVGNIYADESLFRAGVHPRALGSRLSKARAAALHRALQEVLLAAIEGRGSSVRDYVDGRGEAGRFQFEHLVYGRAGEPCSRCRRSLRADIVAGRGTAFCPGCQKK